MWWEMVIHCIHSEKKKEKYLLMQQMWVVEAKRIFFVYGEKGVDQVMPQNSGTIRLPVELDVNMKNIHNVVSMQV